MNLGRYSLVTALIYTFTTFTIIATCFVLFGLAFHHDQTIQILQTAMYVTIAISIVACLIIVTPKVINFRHEQLDREQERKNKEAERIVQKRQAELTLSEARYKAQETQSLAERTRAETQALYIRLRLEEAQTMARIQIETQQSRLVRVGLTESLYYVDDTQFYQISQAQPLQSRMVKSVQDVPLLSSPHAPTFASMKGLIVNENHLVLGYTEHEPVIGTLEDHLLSMLSTGRPKTGKSVALMYYAAMFLKVGVLPIVFDPQNSLQELDGILPYAGSLPSINAFIPNLYQELREREELWSNGRQVKNYSLVVMMDEFPMIIDWENDNDVDEKFGIVRLAKKIILEMRKMHVYVIIAGQGFPHYILPTLTRENTSSRLIFPTSERYASMAGLDEKWRKSLLPIIEKGDKGTAILDCSVMKEPLVIDIPYTTIEDLIYIISQNDMYAELLEKFSGTVEDNESLIDFSQIRKERETEELEEVNSPELDTYTSRVYDACMKLQDRGQSITVQGVWDLLGGGDKNKISKALSSLDEMGLIVRGVKRQA